MLQTAHIKNLSSPTALYILIAVCQKGPTTVNGTNILSEYSQNKEKQASVTLTKKPNLLLFDIRVFTNIAVEQTHHYLQIIYVLVTCVLVARGGKIHCYKIPPLTRSLVSDVSFSLLEKIKKEKRQQNGICPYIYQASVIQFVGC